MTSYRLSLNALLKRVIALRLSLNDLLKRDLARGLLLNNLLKRDLARRLSLNVLLKRILTRGLSLNVLLYSLSYLIMSLFTLSVSDLFSFSTHTCDPCHGLSRTNFFFYCLRLLAVYLILVIAIYEYSVSALSFLLLLVEEFHKAKPYFYTSILTIS